MLFAIKNFVDRGRGLVATTTIRRGTVALEDTAFAAVLNKDAQESHCHFCFAPLSSTTSSTSFVNDSQMLHCSSNCTSNAFAMHNRLLHKCDFTQLDGLVNEGSRRFPHLVVKMVAAALLTGAKFNDYWARALSLAAPKTTATLHLDDEYNAIQSAFEPAIGVEATKTIFSGPLPIQWYSHMIGILHINSIGMGQKDESIVLREMNSSSSLQDLQKRAAANPDVGVGLFPTASLLNHSCEPNLEMFRSSSKHSPSCTFAAVRHIDKGEELTISYISNPSTKPVHERKEYLYYNYGFECTCPSCASV